MARDLEPVDVYLSDREITVLCRPMADGSVEMVGQHGDIPHGQVRVATLRRLARRQLRRRGPSVVIVEDVGEVRAHIAGSQIRTMPPMLDKPARLQVFAGLAHQALLR